MGARLIAVALAVIVVACGGATGAGGSPTPPAGAVMITTAASNQVVRARVGDHIQIALGDQYNWELDAPDGVVLTRPVQSYMLVRGTQAIWLAQSPGRARVHAQGGVNCASGQPCPLLLAVFDATVEVSP